MTSGAKMFLQNKRRYLCFLNRALDNGWLTNNGQFVSEFEDKLRTVLDVSYVQFTSNGTIAMQRANRVLVLLHLGE